MAEKRYYWLKLKEDFFDEKYIKALKLLPQGDSLVIVYLKMQLHSLKTAGVLHYEGIMPDCISELAMFINEQEDVTKLAVEALIKFGVIERLNDDFYMLAMQELVGSEGSSAKRMRDLRDREKTALSQCDGKPSLRYGEIEREIEKELEKDIEGDGNELDSSATAPPKKSKRHKFGEYNHVLLTDEQHSRLIDDFGTDTVSEYVKRVDEYVQMKGKPYKDYNLTIRNWISKDGKGDKNETGYIPDNQRGAKEEIGSKYATVL